MMKIQAVLVCLSLLVISCSTGKMVVNVPAGETVELDYPNDKLYRATIKNRSLKSLSVSVLDSKTDKQVSGFGLGMQGKVDVMVEEGNKLVFKNDGESNVKLKVGIESENVVMLKKDGRKYISFTLQNKTAKSIPLIIPTVMNPNLSPFSKSGVDLKVGQEIIFKSRGRRYVLFTVDASIANDEVIDVAAKLKARKKELGLR